MRVAKRTIFLVLGDVTVAFLALWGAYWLRHDGAFPARFLQHWVLMGSIIATFNAVIFSLLGLYRRLWRYAGVHDLVRIVAATSLALIGQVAGDVIIDFGMPRGVHIIDWLIMLAGVCALRLAIRVHDEVQTANRRPGRSQRVLVAGAGSAGAMVIKEIRRDSHRRYEPVCLVDDDPDKRGRDISGVKVLGTMQDIPRLVDEMGIDEVILAMPSATKLVVRKLVGECHRLDVPLRVVPGISQLIDGRVSVNQLREVQVEDLLGREPVKLDLDGIAGYLRGKRILVTGAGGSIGSEIVRQVSRFGPELIIMLGRGENSIYEIEQEMYEEYPGVPISAAIGDVRDGEMVDRLFERFRPQVVFHAAAHKHVPLMEKCPEEAVKNNIFGTHNVVASSEKYGVERFVLISTDKAVNPVNIYGATKRASELIVQKVAKDADGAFSSIRLGNVLGSRCSVSEVFLRQIRSGGPVVVSHPEMARYFITESEAAQHILLAAALSRGGEIFAIRMGAEVKILDLANRLIRSCGLEPSKDIHIAFCGQRAGERLSERIASDNEKLVSTSHDRIWTVELRPHAVEKENQRRNGLLAAVRSNDPGQIVEFIRCFIIAAKKTDESPQTSSKGLSVGAL